MAERLKQEIQTITQQIKPQAAPATATIAPEKPSQVPFAEEQKIVSHNILGELLGYLRQKNHISLLSACREITSIQVQQNAAHIQVQTHALADILKFEKNQQILLAFFKKKGLTYTVEQKQDTSTKQTEQKLTYLFGKNIKFI